MTPEFEGVVRDCFGLSRGGVSSVLRHLPGLYPVTVADRGAVEQALPDSVAGVDFVDALHHASDRACASVAVFDDRRSAPRPRKPVVAPAVMFRA